MKFTLLLSFTILIVQAATVFAVDRSICGPNADVSNHANGKLKCCSNTSQKYVQDSLSCNASSETCFFDNGQVSSCTVAGSYSAGPIVCGESGFITFYTSGALKTCTLNNPTVINGRKCMGSQPVNLFEDGSLSSCSEQGF